MTKRIVISAILFVNSFFLYSQTPDFEVNSSNFEFCLNDTVSFTNLSENYDYLSWDFGDGYQTYFENPKHIYAQNGIYTVALTVYLQSGENNSISKQLIINALPQLTLSPSADTSINFGSTIEISASGNFETIIWSSGQTDNIISVNSEGMYICEVQNSENECKNRDSVYISVIGNNAQGQEGLVLNNILSPNGDGINDYLLINESLKINEKIELSIFNQAGNLVFFDSDYSNNWNGTDNSGNNLPVGTYYFMIKIENQTGTSGFIDILR